MPGTHCAAAPAGEFAPAGVCAGCHRDIAQRYAQTGMGRSLFRPSPPNMRVDFATENGLYHAASDTHYAMYVRDGAYYQRRWQIGAGGKEINAEEARIDYVLGSGSHARSYLSRTPRGSLIELPAGWYAEKGGYWGMGPGFDSPHPPAQRLVSYECIFCHDGYPQIPSGDRTLDAEPIFIGELPEGIDCQRCHGPGERHVAAARSGASRELIRSRIVNPARLNSKLRLDLCMQCHLEPTSTRLPALIRRLDRGPFSFRPGEPLESFELVFDHAPNTGHDDKFEIVGSSAYRLRQSRCFLASNGALTCERCHDPHGGTRDVKGACRSCHASKLDAMIAGGSHPASDDCAGCHMPKRRTEDAVHVVMTDHRIQRSRPAGNPLAGLVERHPSEAQEYRGAVVPYYPRALRPGDEPYRALAQVVEKNNLAASVEELARLIASRPPRESEWYVKLGDAWLAAGEKDRAASAYAQAARLNPRSVRALRSWAEALKALGQTEQSEQTLQRAVRMDPSDALAWYQSGSLALGRQDTNLAIERLRKAAELNPDVPGVYTTLAFAHSGAGRRDDALADLRAALRIDPCDAAAWDLLGRLLAHNKELPDALNSFERAIRYRPRFAPYLYDYALGLTEAGETERAERLSAAAEQADPEFAEPHALAGRLLAAKRRFADAEAEYRKALELRPSFTQVRLDLASVLYAQGDVQQAIEQLREVVRTGDENSARTAREALRRLESAR